MTIKAEQNEQAMTRASRKRRILAFLIDHFLITFLLVGTSFLFIGSGFLDEENPGKMASVMFTVLIPGFILYFSKDFIKGISFGKWIMGIMIREEKHVQDIPRREKLFLRNLFTMLWPLEFLFLVFNKNKQRIGDKAAGTIVLVNPSKAKKLHRVIAMASIGSAVFLCTTIHTGNIMKNSEAYKLAIYNIESNQEALDITGGITGYGFMPSGNINVTNGYGKAHLQIDVKGKNQDIKLNTLLEKKPNGNWTLLTIEKMD